MSATDAQILANARQALVDILAGKVESFGDGSETAKTLRITELRQLIEEYEAKVNRSRGRITRPLIHGDIDDG